MNVLFPVAMVIEGASGLMLLLVPGVLCAPLGLSLDETSTLLARLFGSALVGFALLLWTARRAEEPALREGVLLALFAYYVVSGAMFLVAELRFQLSVLGWGPTALHLALAGWFGWYVIRGAPTPARQP